VDERVVELAALSWLQSIGYALRHGPELAPDAPGGERSTYHDAVLVARFRDALARLNPQATAEALDDAYRKVLHPDGPSLVGCNRALHRYLVEGVTVEQRRPDGSIAGVVVRLLDDADPANNDWLAVSQFTIMAEGCAKRTRRMDIVLFVNGLPLVLIELKNAADEEATPKNAYNQIQTYKHDLKTLFSHNAFCVASDGLEARAGTLTSDWERFAPWRDAEHGKKGAAGKGELQTLIEGMLNPRTLLDLIRNFIVFEDDGEKVVKKLASYHQVGAVNKAVAEAVHAAADGGDRKAGVVWHTQGSGKSLSMVFFAGKLIQEPAMANPTLVVLTDRNDLDQQLFGTFAACAGLLRQTPVQAESREHLMELLRVASGGVIFTTIQKFLPESVGERLSPLTQRTNVVVIADEAHRSQAGLAAKGVKTDDGMVLAVGLAQHVRDALPQATFIGFTGTPIKTGDKSTPRIFGKYIDIYDIKRAVEDRATVPIFYEARLARLRLKDEERPHLDPEFDEITEDEEEAAREKLKTKWAAVEKLVGAAPRLKEVARDLVEHFDKRYEAMPGKAMIVCMSRRICVDLYDQIIKLKPEWHSADDARGRIKIVMTGSADDPETYRPHVRNKGAARAMAKRFKNPQDELTLVIVRDMWLTGFDAPCVHTMYVDKPMGGHNLMQAIARVNRVFKDKPGGLVVDYLGLADQLKSAMRDYTDSGGEGNAVEVEAEAIRQLQLKYEQCMGILHGFDWREAWLKGTPAQRLALIPAAQDFLSRTPDGVKRFLDCTVALGKAFALASGSDEAMALRDEIAFFQVVRTALTKTTVEGQRHAETLDTAINQLIAGAIHSTGILNVFDAAGLKNPNIEILSDEFLAEVRAMPHRNLAFELLKKLINGEIKHRAKKNVVQARRFSEMLENAIRQYQNRAILAAQVIDELIAMAKELKADDARSAALGMDDTEIAFYDALAENDSAVQALGNDSLKVIAVELVKTVKANTTIDWTVKENVQANLRRLVKRILRKYGYPPDLQEKATQTVLEQAKVLCADIAG
jgi:type I restriction enzyme R subunit